MSQRAHPRTLAPALVVALAAASLAVIGSAGPAEAVWTPPAGCSISASSHVTCQWNKPAGTASYAVTVPTGTTTVAIMALGQRGGAAAVGGATGGRADVVTGTTAVTGGEVLTVSFPDDGGSGNGGGGNGGDSARVSRAGTALVIAAGGGGAGNGGASIYGSGPGGNGGDAGAAGAPGIDLANGATPPTGGGGAGTSIPGTGGSPGSGGLECSGGPGSSGSTTAGGGGGFNYGGGGGGGLRGGGGGGGAGSHSFAGDCHSGAGGGGGSSLVPSGGSRRLATTFETTSLVRLEFDLHSIAQVSAPGLAFNNVIVGQTSPSQTVTLTNTGDGPLVPGTSSVTGPFQRTDGCVGLTVPSGGSCTIQVRFTPTTTGLASGVLTIPSNATNGTRTVSLSGNGVAPVLSAPTSLAFGDQVLGGTSSPKSLVISNTGDASLVVNSVNVLGSHAADFVIGNACVTTIAPGASCTATVSFRPMAKGARTATVRITSNAPAGTHNVSLSGNGVATTATLFRGPGTYYTAADEATATIAVADHGNVAQYFVKVTNTGTTATSYNFVLGKSGTPSNAQVNIKGGAILPLDANGNWITPVIQPGKYREFAVKVTPNGTGQSISKVQIALRHPNGALATRSFSETNTDAPLKGTDGFGLFARAGSQRWIGGSFDGQITTAASLALNQTATFTTRLRNDGTAARSMEYAVLGTPTPCWTRVVKVGTVDITAAATGAGYVTKTLNPGQYLDVKVLVKRVAAAGCSGIAFTAVTRDAGTTKHFSHLLSNPKA